MLPGPLIWRVQYLALPRLNLSNKEIFRVSRCRLRPHWELRVTPSELSQISRQVEYRLLRSVGKRFPICINTGRMEGLGAVSEPSMNFEDYVRFVKARLREYRVADGRYQRHILRTGHETEGRADAYGTADAANILYTLGELPGEGEARRALSDGIKSFQDPLSGIFVDPTHSDYHTTAHCIAALELFDLRPDHKLRFLAPLVAEPGNLETFLDQLDWMNPWQASHDGAGVAAALALSGEAGQDWFDRYFGWLDAEVDTETGWWRRGRMLPTSEYPGRFGNLAGSFHYHFNYYYFRRPLPYAERVIDSCLNLYADGLADLCIKTVGFKDIDWIFCLNRALRQTGHRRQEAVAALAVVAARALERLSDRSHLESEEFDDLHNIFGGLCAVAELQLALPGRIRTERPLRFVLDRRPFI